MTYAKDTSVTADRSRAEIENTLRRYGASSFSYGWEEDRAAIVFKAQDRQVRFVLALPDRNDRRFTHTEARGTKRSAAQAEASWEQACRAHWRALALVVKAKLQAIESGISTFETEFMAHVVLPDGSTVGDFMGPQIERAYETSSMPPLLALGSGE